MPTMTKTPPTPLRELKLRFLAELEMFDRDDITRVRILRRACNAIGVFAFIKGWEKYVFVRTNGERPSFVSSALTMFGC